MVAGGLIAKGGGAEISTAPLEGGLNAGGSLRVKGEAPASSWVLLFSSVMTLLSFSFSFLFFLWVSPNDQPSK